MSYVQYAEPYPQTRGDRFGATAGRAHPHRGQDTAPGGLPALALADGIFIGARWSNVLGNCAAIKHADGKKSGYAHLANTNGVVAGRSISRGAAFGLLGATGSAARGRHLHYTVGDDDWGVFQGHVQDPLTWIADHSGPQTHNADGGMYTATETDGVPGPVFYSLVQRWAQDWGYTGPLDGKPGPATWAAVQRALVDYGYRGPIDGAPGRQTFAAWQRWARQGGYTGPDDGALGKQSYRAIACTLNVAY